MASYVQYRALGEGFSSKMWRKHTGFLLWKSQSPVPSLRGQLYDYYLQPTAALYGFKKVCSIPPPRSTFYHARAGRLMPIESTSKVFVTHAIGL
jgi:hypothetical protein